MNELRFRRLAPVAVSLVGVGLLACRTGRGAGSADATRTDAIFLADALHAYQGRTGHLPERLADLCPHGAPCSVESGAVIEATPRDAWGRPFEYRTSGGSFEIRSSGPDGVRFTGDDVVYAPMLERAQVLRVAGCYRTSPPARTMGTTLLVLDTVPIRPGAHAYRIKPPLAGEEGGWAPAAGDSVQVAWGKVRSFVLGFVEDELRGYQVEATEHRWSRGAAIVAHRLGCDLRNPPDR